MGFARIAGIVIAIIGIALIGAGYYIKIRVEEGQEQIGNAQQKVDRGNSLFSQNPISKQIGQGVTGSAQKKIDKANAQVEEYSILSGRLQIIGIIAAVAGVALAVFGKKRKRT
jgi:hypothetical protein